MAAFNCVRQVREARGLSQVALARLAGLSRQSLGAVEAGRAVPGVDVAMRLARSLGCRVEELFAPPEPEPVLEVRLAGDRVAPRIALAFLRGRWMGLPLICDDLRTFADALLLKTRGRRAVVAPLRPLAEARDNLVLMGCAVGLGVLVDRLHAHRGAGRFLWVPSSSGAALGALANGSTHVAGVHSVAGRLPDTNIEAARRVSAPEPLVLVTLASWEAGLLSRPNDARIRDAADLAHPGVRLVTREKGAGARRLLEQTLRAAGAPPDRARSALTASGHLEVARAIALGAADVGVASRDAALALGLRFLPLAEERYDLVIPRHLVTDARIQRLLDVLVSQAARRELHALGYDVSNTGTRVAEVRA